MKNKIEDLRDHLFATLEALQDEDQPMDISRAKAIADVGKVIVESAKAETRHIEVMGGTGSDFIPDGPRPKLSDMNGRERKTLSQFIEGEDRHQ